MVKNLPAMWETRVRSVGWKDPLEEEMRSQLQCSCLENPMGRGDWQAIVHEVAKSQTQLKGLGRPAWAQTLSNSQGRWMTYLFPR